VSLGTAEMRGREVSLVGINICRWPLPNSLTGPRDIEACLRSLGGKLYHMGFHSRVARSTLADANDSHDWRIYADFAHVLIRLARPLYAADPIDVDLDQSLYALDSTTIDLCLSLFPWAKFRRHKAAVKMHTLLDLHGNIPTFISITSGRVHADITSNRLTLLKVPLKLVPSNSKWPNGHGSALTLLLEVGLVSKMERDE